LYCEPFEERIDLPRGAREEALRAYVTRYAGRLEHYCRLAPDNWFNFYDFWSPP
jgi:predicted LPLAT superfamily acyltransferase